MSKSETASFPGRYDSLPAIAECVGRVAESAGMDMKGVYAVQLAVDEACSNIIEHAYDESSPGDIHFTCEVTGSRLRLTLRDTGKPFDPSVVPEPDLACALEDRQVGGLGIYLMRKIMDEVHFEVGEAGNTLTLTKRLDREG